MALLCDLEMCTYRQRYNGGMAGKKEKPLLVLIDSHAIIHRAYHALPDLTDSKGNPAGALYGLASMLVKLVKDLAPDYVVAAYDLAGPTHRHEVYKEYKGKRAKIEDPLVEQLTTSRNIFAAFGIPVYEAKGFEADDIIGTLAEALKAKYRVVIASGDMDTLQLVEGKDVQVFTLRKGLSDTVLYDEDAVIERYGFGPEHIADYKGLSGDPSDNIIGVPGIGAKTATKLIQTYGSVEKIYKKINNKKITLAEWKELGITERILNLLREHQEEAEFSKVLATIRRDAPVTFDPEGAHWEKNFSPEVAKKIMNGLGFRSLVPRLEQLAAGSVQEADSEIETASRGVVQAASSVDTTSQLFKEAAVLCFLLNPETTNPSFDDIAAAAGTENLEDAHAELLARVKKENLLGVFESIEQPLIAVIDTMNANGVAIDAAYLKKLSTEYHAELDRLAKNIYQKAGKEFNINSPKQLGDVLFVHMGITQVRAKKTATGQLSTKESELVKLKDAHPIVADVLEYRELAKLLGTYIDAIPPYLDREGRLHTTFIQTGAATGRFASKNPGIQNIPIKTELGRRIRNAFVAPPGSTLLTFDYSQIELRLAAILSGDENLSEIFKKGGDVHAAVAARVFGVPEDKVEREMRRRAKVINFGILYGMGVNALREQLGTSREEAQAFMNRYFETFAGLAEYLTKTKAEATRVGYTMTLFGRKRYFPGLKSKLPFIRASNERMAINAPIQGTQADVIKLAMLRIHDEIEKHFSGSAKMVLQIHDELMFEVEQSAVDDFAPVARHAMESVMSVEQTNGVPIIVSGSVGQNWGEMEELAA